MPLMTTTITDMFLITIVIFTLITNSSAEMKMVKLQFDTHHTILLEKFSFTKLDWVEVDVSHITVASVAKPVLNRLEFFFVDEYSFQRLLRSLGKFSILYVRLHLYITLLFTLCHLSDPIISCNHIYVSDRSSSTV